MGAPQLLYRYLQGMRVMEGLQVLPCAGCAARERPLEIFEKNLMVLLSNLKTSFLWRENIQDWDRLIEDVD